jgi:hypothetical protein
LEQHCTIGGLLDWVHAHADARSRRR